MLHRFKKIPIVRKSERGVGLIDVLVSIAVITLAFWSFYQVAVLGVRVKRESERRDTAVFLAQEAIEAARFARDESWSTNIIPLALETDYYVSVSGTQWVFSTTDPGLINNLYTRTVRFDQVLRDTITDDIAASGVEDTDTREVTVTVLWGEEPKSYEIVTYLTNFLFN